MATSAHRRMPMNQAVALRRHTSSLNCKEISLNSPTSAGQLLLELNDLVP
jgi:hypothetical protein